MSVDFDAIARAGRCDVSSLRLALPLLEQGYTPPFLARYRRDELSGIDEASLWALSNAVKAEQQLTARRDELKATWEQTSLRDPAIGQAIGKAHTSRVLSRIARLLKSESSNAEDDPSQLAVRVLNPRKGDGTEFAEIASKVEGIKDPAAAVAGLDQAIAKRLLSDPRIVASATRWLARNAQIHVESISDPHGGNEPAESKKKGNKEKGNKGEKQSGSEEIVEVTSTEMPNTEMPNTEKNSTEKNSIETATTTAPATPDPSTSTSTPSTSTPSAEPPSTEPEVPSAETPAAGAPAVATTATTEVTAKAEVLAKKVPATKQPKESATKKSKKISPRQRRRRWLVSVLKPLSGKRFKSDKLSAFQIVMLGRALRSQVAKCAFQYDATKLVAEIQKTASGINRPLEGKIREWVLEHEANIREAAESAWWDDLAERASTRLVNVAANHLRRHVNRGGVDAKVVMSIDAVGPRTAAAAIVTADGRLLHSEDIPCQLSAAQRSQAVTKMGELIHHHHVDLIVISNGPARRATMIALSDLIKQSPEKSIRWTLADRSGADAYSGSPVADQEMRSTPRRFRAAAWLAFSVLQPAQAITKVDPLKLRLSSFQRELSDDAISGALEDVLISGASRGGVDVNSAPVSWLARLPGMTASIAEAIDTSRRDSLFPSRDAIAELEQWETAAQSRQAIPFLRVFGSEQTLDGTLIHPEDYALAQKLAKLLEIELPPSSPPGYEPPNFDAEPEPAQLSETESKQTPAPVEDFTSAGENAPDFEVPESKSVAAETPTADGEATTDNAESLATEPTAADAVAIETVTETESAAETDQTTSTESEQDLESEPVAPAVEQAKKPAPAPEVHAAFKQPLPERAKISKCVKEWQIGTNRANQIVHWLCEPFGDSDVSGTPPAVMSHVPTTSELKPGDPVIGVVVSVMPFGVFVELAPDCSGLIHVSRVSESFVEDLHEVIQVGDIVSAWVIGIDQKRRRVGLSAISPERAKKLEEQRHARSDRRPQRAGGPVRQGNRGGDRNQAGGDAQRTSGNAGRPTGRGKPQGKAGGGRTGKERQAGRPQGGGRGGRDSNRGGRGRERKPESYRVESKRESKPISEEMQKGKEPMRTFGDLAQFFDKDTGKDKPAADSKKADEAKGSKPPKESDKPAAQPLPATEQPKAEQPKAELPKPEPPAPQSPEPVTKAADTKPPTDPLESDSNAPDAPDAPTS